MKVFSQYNALFLLTSPQILKYYNIGMRKTLLLLCTLPCLTITAQESNSYTLNFDKNQSYSHSSRRLNGVSLSGSADGTQQIVVSNPNKVYSRENLLKLVWGSDYPGDVRTVDVHIRRLREKIEKNPSEPKYVHTKWGVGYYYK